MQDDDKIIDSLSDPPSTTISNNRRGWLKLTAEYLRDLPRQLDQIRASLRAKDFAAIKKHAHRIKGTAGTYHLDAIVRAVRQLEQLAENRVASAIDRNLTEIVQLVEKEAGRIHSQIALIADRSQGSENG